MVTFCIEVAGKGLLDQVRLQCYIKEVKKFTTEYKSFNVFCML